MPAKSPRKRDANGTVFCTSKRRQTVKNTPVTGPLSTCQKQCPTSHPHPPFALQESFTGATVHSRNIPSKPEKLQQNAFPSLTRLGSEKVCIWKFRWSLGNWMSASLDCEKYEYLELLVTDCKQRLSSLFSAMANLGCMRAVGGRKMFLYS